MNHDPLPACLSWSADPKQRINQSRSLPAVLFLQLYDVLRSTEPPAPALVRTAWDERLKLPTQGNDGVSDETLTSWIIAYEIAWQLRHAAGAAAVTGNATDTYVQSCAKLLAGRATRNAVPIVTVDGNADGRPQTLWIDTVEDQNGLILLHPQFEPSRKVFQADFAASIETAWLLAGEGISPGASAFWHVSEEDGSPIISEQQGGTSASAAAFRAFWHLRRGLRLDGNVFVLATCASGDGRIHDVGDLGAKISAIQQRPDSVKHEGPATIVVAANTTTRTPRDDNAIAAASGWAEVRTVATTADLIAVRSCTASAAIAYMTHLAEKLDETPWRRDGKPVLLSEVHVPSQVWKDDYSSHLVADAESSGGERDWRPAGYDPASADREVAPRLKPQQRKVRVPWIAEFLRPRHHPIVVVGGPGFGKTSLLRWTAREMVLESLAALRARSKAWPEVRWPIITDLAAWLSNVGDSHDTLRDGALDFAPLPKTHPQLQREALPQMVERRLIAQTEHTHLFLDALDQVPMSQLRLLRKRLAELGAAAPRLVFSTREAALSSHLPSVPFPRITILEAAGLSTDDARALAAKWLDPKLATRLEAHLRSQSTTSVVADSPLLLTLACGIVARSPDAELPETAAYLYRDLMRSLARGEWRDEGTGSVHEPIALLDRLRSMAWRLFSRENVTNRFSRDTLIRALSGGSGSAGTEADAALHQLCYLGFLERSGHSQGEPHYHFRHATFLEFLAAAHLAAEINADGWAHAKVTHWHSENGWQPINISDLLDANALEPSWEPLFAFTAGLLDQPKPLLEMLADQDKDDVYRHRLRLLCMCYGSFAADKEDSAKALMDRVLPLVERMGRIARRRHPDRWKGWLATVGHLLNLPSAGSRITKVLMSDEDHEHRMMGRHELLEILARAAQHLRCNAGMETLLAICERGADHHDLHDAAAKAVALAERLGLPQSIRRLELAMDAAAAGPHRQITLARALLRVSDGQVAKRACDLLSAIAESKSMEEWHRTMAVQALEETFGTPLEAQGMASMMSRLFDSSYVSSHPGQWAAARELIKIAQRCSPELADTTLVIQRLVLSWAFDGSHSLHDFCTGLIRTGNATAQCLGIGILLIQVREEDVDCFPRVQAAELLVEHGGDSEREEALSVLTGMAKAPIGDGRCRYLALRALLKSGHAYDDEIREGFREIGMAAGVHCCWIVNAAEVAREHNDASLFEALMPRLQWIMNSWKTSHGSDEPGASDRDRVAKLLFGRVEWEPLERHAFDRLRGDTVENREDWFSVSMVCFGAKSSALVTLTEELLAIGKSHFCPWVPLMRELARRGWRFQVSRRRLVILRHGQEESRADADFGY